MLALPTIANAAGVRDKSAVNFFMIMGLAGGVFGGASLASWIETLLRAN